MKKYFNGKLAVEMGTAVQIQNVGDHTRLNER